MGVADSRRGVDLRVAGDELGQRGVAHGPRTRADRPQEQPKTPAGQTHGRRAMAG
jgi:hypothetical protein